MTTNVGAYDRVIRVVIGSVLIGIASYGSGLPFITLACIGIIPFATGVLGWCPVYKILGINTVKEY